MKQLRPGLWMMESSSSWGCNTYLLEDEGRLFLVDPGPKFQLKRLARELRAAGRSPYDVTDILLTHYDQDHTRSAAEWRRRTGATAYLGAADAQVLRSHVVPGSWQRRFMMRLLGLAELPEGTVELRGEVAIAPGLTAIPAPGHTPGHYAFVWKDVALIGDTANCGPDGELLPFDAALMTDFEQSEQTRAMLSALPVRLFCAGHSEPLERGTPPLDKHAHRIHIDAPVDDVFRFVEDPVHVVDAMPAAHSSLETVTRTPEGLVDTFAITHHRLGMTGKTVFTREEYVVNERIVDRSSAGVFLTYTVERDPGGTTLTLGWHSSTLAEALDAVFFHADTSMEHALVTVKRAIEGATERMGGERRA